MKWWQVPLIIDQAWIYLLNILGNPFLKWAPGDFYPTIDFSAWFDRKIYEWAPGNFCIFCLVFVRRLIVHYIFQPTTDM